MTRLSDNTDADAIEEAQTVTIVDENKCFYLQRWCVLS